jgi:H+/Cl- antiporter ClcA
VLDHSDDPEPDQSTLFRLIGVGALVGVASAGGVVAFLAVEHQLHALLWEDVPHTLGGTPAWWVFAVLVLGAVGVWGATRLPGHGGYRPLDEMRADIGPAQVTSVVLATMISLSVGAVLGPEAPLMAVGSAIGAAVAWHRSGPVREILMLAGAVSAITMILGNPVISAILVLEATALRGGPGGKRAMTVALPLLVAMGFSYLIQVGVGNWSGVGAAQLGVPGLPAYPTVELVDLVVGLLVAVVTAALAVLAVEAGKVFQARVRQPLMGLLGGAVVVAAAAVITRAITGEPVGLVLFSGQDGIGDVLALTSVGALLLIAMAKTIGYAASLGSGFRGGMLFPAVFLGVVVATATALLIDGTSVSALSAAGIAAAVGGVMRLPFTAVVLALLLCAPAGLAVTTPAIIGGVVGVLMRVAADARLAVRTPEPVDE